MTGHGDTELFRKSMGDVKPIPSSVQIPLNQPVIQTPGIVNRRRSAQAESQDIQHGLASKDYIVAIEPHDILSFKRDGVQHGVFKKLRLGKYEIESRIDLHRLDFNQARDQIAAFVAECITSELRCVLITHGRGEYRNPPALLKSSVNHWLQQLDAVLAFHSAQAQQGGSGSTYVLFRKGPGKKSANAEQFGLRG